MALRQSFRYAASVEDDGVPPWSPLSLPGSDRTPAATLDNGQRSPRKLLLLIDSSADISDMRRPRSRYGAPAEVVSGQTSLGWDKLKGSPC